MFYTMYLSSVCQRRQWPDPHYEPFSTQTGHFCKVRVNNREYSTEVPYASEALARDGAAQKAYMICRNFSVNDGMVPGHRPGQRSSPGGAIQGLPVAIGSGRRRGPHGGDAAAVAVATAAGPSPSPSSSDYGTSSGENSPRSTDSGFDAQMHRHLLLHPASSSINVIAPTPPPPRQQQRNRHATAAAPAPIRFAESTCLCMRGPVRAYSRCGFCLRESGWA